MLLTRENILLNDQGITAGPILVKGNWFLLHVFFLTEERLLSKPRKYNSPTYSVLSKYVLQDSNSVRKLSNFTKMQFFPSLYNK